MPDLFYGHFKWQRILSGNLHNKIILSFLVYIGFFSFFELMTFPIFFPIMKFVDINLQQRRFLGIQFIIWSGGSWIKNNGANFCVGLNSITSGKVGLFTIIGMLVSSLLVYTS